MNVREALEKRESCRAYAPGGGDRAIIEECLSAARLAPSSCNTQPWKVIAVDREPELAGVREALSGERVGINKFLSEVPVFLAVVKEKRQLSGRAAEILSGHDLSDVDIGIFAQSICLEATEMGLATCIIGWIDQDKLRAALHIPAQHTVPVVIALGHAFDPNPREKRRKPLTETLFYNAYPVESPSGK